MLITIKDLIVKATEVVAIGSYDKDVVILLKGREDSFSVECDTEAEAVMVKKQAVYDWRKFLDAIKKS